MSRQETNDRRRRRVDQVMTSALHVAGVAWALAEVVFVLAYRLCGVLGMAAGIVWLLIELAT